MGSKVDRGFRSSQGPSSKAGGRDTTEFQGGRMCRTETFWAEKEARKPKRGGDGTASSGYWRLCPQGQTLGGSGCWWAQLTEPHALQLPGPCYRSCRPISWPGSGRHSLPRRATGCRVHSWAAGPSSWRPLQPPVWCLTQVGGAARM